MALTGKSAEKWKKENYNMGIKVSQATINKLKKGTKPGNIAAANKPGASAEYKEAVRRFYGKNTVKSTVTQKGPTPGSPNDRENRPPRQVTPNQREDRRSVPYIKPNGGPGEKPRPPRPSGGPGSRPLPKKPVTPNQREGRKSIPSVKPSGGPGEKSRPPRASAKQPTGPGGKPRPSKGQTPNQREGRKSIPRTNTPGPGGRNVRPKPPKGGPGAKPRTKSYKMNAGG